MANNPDAKHPDPFSADVAKLGRRAGELEV